MIYIEAPQDWRQTQGWQQGLPLVFLAGGIGNCPDWQTEAAANLADTDAILLNPRRKQFRTPWNRADSQEQITWEYEALQDADIILFWFTGGPSAQPIALFELGTHATRATKPIVVGRDPDYLRADDIDIQLGLYAPELKICTSLDEVCDEVRGELKHL
jgi:Nucleoside 2-deoxyribosyltransferase like